MIDIDELLVVLRNKGCFISKTTIEELWKPMDIKFIE